MEALLRLLGNSKKILGIFGLLVVICGFTAAQDPDAFLQSGNIQNTLRWTALFGIIAIGVSFVIMTGGIDLSIGSVIGLLGCILAMCLTTTYSPEAAFEVTNVDPAARRLSFSGPSPPAVGEQISFLDNTYSISEASGGELVVAEEVRTGEATGQAVLAHRVVELKPAADEFVQRGSIQMQLREIILDGAVSVSPDDRIEMLYDVGLAQQFVVVDSQSEKDQTTVRFLTRKKLNVRDPVTCLISSRSQRMPVTMAILIVLGLALLIGLAHGLLITKLKLQPFIVTLCGLLFYRGLSRFITSDQEQGFGAEFPDLKLLANGDIMRVMTGQEYDYAPPMPFIYLIVLGIVAAIFLNRTIFGRYILALGNNEEAAKYSGINTDRMVILTYMICSFCAGLAAILFALDLNSIQPSAHGEFYELYAIAAAVLGGCSLRGGEGSILGVMIAAAVMRVLSNAINLIDGLDTSTEFAIIGLVILSGVIVDELVKRLASQRRAIAQAKELAKGKSDSG
ncbi:MAG: ABC transporter permease [Planctomycetota bacterium]